MTETIRVLLADDHPAMRVGLRVLLEQSPDIQVVGETSDGKETLAQIETLCPDVVVLDCEMPGLSGTQVAAELKQRDSPTRILALSAYSDENYVRGMIQSGAVGYLLKDEAPDRIVQAVRGARRGERWFSAKIAAHMAEWMSDDKSKKTELTEREVEVLRLVTQGKTNKQIGKALGISEKAIEKHLTEIFGKLNVSSRAAAAAWAARNRIG